jgi:hypothetical protein
VHHKVLFIYLFIYYYYCNGLLWLTFHKILIFKKYSPSNWIFSYKNLFLWKSFLLATCMQYIFGLRIWDKLWCYWGIYWVHTKHATWALQPQPIAWREIICLILFITIFGLDGFCRFPYLGYLLWFILIILSSCDHFILFYFIAMGYIDWPITGKNFETLNIPPPK